MDAVMEKMESPLGSSFSMNPRQYFVFCVLLGSAAYGIGYALVDYLRLCCRTYKNIQRLAAVVFLTPFFIFVILNVLLFLGFAERMLCDALSFGVAVGILFRLSYKPSGPSTIKLVSQEINGRTVDVWLDTLDEPMGDVRAKIAEALGVSPASRVAIESGKGNFVEDATRSFSSIMDDSMKTVDFFGFITLKCFMKIREEEKRLVASDNVVVERRGSMGAQFLNILQKSEVKYGESIVLIAKIAASADFKTPFQVALIDKFAAASPTSLSPQLPLVHMNSLKVHAWTGGEGDGREGSDAGGDTTSNASSNNRSTPTRSSPIFLLRKKFNKEKSAKAGSPLRNGDIITFEVDGKFMSVTRGWWMAWSSLEPRRSGAFIIDLVERAPQNKLKEQLGNIKEKILHSSNNSNVDDIVKPGDTFRLKSLKFPEFELGLTSVKIRDDYCYLGLRKSSDHVQGGDDAWCMEMRFAFKA